MPEKEQVRERLVPPIILLAALAMALLALGVYLRTLHPGVGPSLDSLELQIAALVRGIIHPPGSPQYLMLGSLAMEVLPGPNAAYRLNLMSALFAAATVGVTFLLTFRLTQNLFVSSFAALGLGLGPRLWYQASIAELYAVNALYVVLVLYLLVAWHQSGRPAAYWAAVAVYALSFGNHTSMILLLPAFVYVVEITDRSMLLRPRNLAVTAAIVLAAAAQYAYIPIRAAASPPFCNYCPTPSGPLVGYLSGPLLDYLTGGPFKGQMFALPRRELLDRLPESVGLVARQFMPWGAALGVVGTWELFRRRAALAWALVLGLAAQYLFVISYAIPDWHDFLTPVYVCFAPLVGYGALRVWELLQPQAEALLIRGRTLAGNAYPVALVGLLVLSLGINFTTYLPVVDQSGETAFEVNGRVLLARAEPGAWLVMPRPTSPAFYYSWAVRYLSLAGGQPSDLAAIAPPEVDPPPGPPPTYLRWEDVAGQLTPGALSGSGRQVLALDWADDRFDGWGLLPVCAPDGATIAGYEVVAVLDGGHPQPLVEAARWELVQDYVVFEGADFRCPPDSG